MIEVHIHWIAVPGSGIESVLVAVNQVNYFDAGAIRRAVTAALNAFDGLAYLTDNGKKYDRVIQRIDVRQTAQKIIQPGAET